MKTSTHTYFNSDTTNRFTLELSDFDYLKDEFTIKEGSLGFDLTSKKNPKLSIHIGSYDIKYDRDISDLGMFLAKERISVAQHHVLSSVGEKPHDYKSLLPRTSDELEQLIHEFKYYGLGNVKIEDVTKFLNKHLVVSI